MFGKHRRDLALEQKVLRVDRKTKRLTKRLRPGQVAVINHADIDRVAAEALVACKPVAVLNAAKSTTGCYPNMGPSIIVEAGILLIDDMGEKIMEVPENTLGEIRDNSLYVEGKLVASGVRQTPQTIAVNLAVAREELGEQIELFAENTLDYLRKERDLLLEGVGVPEVKTDFRDRPVVIVVRGYHYREDLASIRPFIREHKPVLVGVDGGADAILEAGYKPDMIIGDMDSVTDRALKCGAEIVVHAYRDGQAPGAKKLNEQGIAHVLFPAVGTSEDVAMLLADDKGASMIVALGTHTTLVEFLDKGRSGMSSTFLTRLKVGSKLIDAKGVSQLYHPSITRWQMLIFVAVALFAVGGTLAVTPVGHAIWGIMGVYWNQFLDTLSWLGGFGSTHRPL